MTHKPSCEELEERIEELEKEAGVRKRAEEELGYASQYVRSLIEASLDPLMMISPEGKITDVNEAAVKVSGVGREELIGTDFSNCFTEPELAREGYLEGFEKGFSIDYPLTIRHSSGKLTHVLCNASVYRDVSGNIVGVFAAARDITERKRAEESLRNSERDLNRAQLVAKTGSWRLDVLKNELVCSDEAYRIFGVQKGTPLTYEIFLAHVHPEDRDYVDRNWSAALLGESYDIEHRVMVGGEVVWVRERAELEFDENGTAQAGFGTVQDITERKQVEESLRESQQMLNLVLNTIPVRVFWKDLDLKYSGCNRPFAYDAGLQSPEEIIGRSDFDMGWTEEVQLYVSDDRTVIETGRPKLGFEEPQTRSNGEKIWLRTSKVPLLDVQGRIKGVLGTYEDITVQKLAEHELQKAHDELERRVKERTAELEKANQELRQIPSKLISVQEEERKRLASDLHDSIGQTLAAIKLWLEMTLKLRDEGNFNAAFTRLEEFVPILQRSIDETRSIYMGLRPSMLDSEGLIAALDWLRHECMKLYPDRHIEIDVGVLEEEIPEILKVIMFRIVQEALNNVAKHSNAEWVDVSLLKKEGRIEVVVSDNGVGMDVDQVLQTSTASSLGLTSMRERAELTGGSFTIESAPGKGATVRVSLPLKGGECFGAGDITQ